MADSNIQLPADGVGKKLDTRTVPPDLDHREVVVVGSPTTADVAEVDAANGLDVDVTRSALPTGAATAANQLPNSHDVTVDNAAGAAAVNIQDGGNSITVDGTLGISGTVDTELPAAAALADNTANPTVPAVGAFGQVWDGATWDRTPGNSTDGALVNLGANNDVTVTGAVTANAGTNLNTSALALEAGGNLAAAAASLSVIDDWDETDRAKVNTIAGQVGVQGGSGTINALTQRVVLATDQPTVPVSLAAGGTTQYAEDTVHVSGDQVTLAGVVQQTADAALSSDGDRSLLQVDASGFLKVNIKAGAGSGGTAMADDAAFTPATTQGTPAFALADETSPDSVDEGDAGALRMTLDRKLLTRIVGATDANRLDVDGSGHAQVDIAAASVTVPVSAASLPLPTGAATSALQTQPGVDIGDVTVNNAAGASAVNVQDGGNSLTVDGTVAVTGVSTLAEQQTQTTHLATIAGDTTDIEAAVELIDDTVKVFGTDTYTEATTKGLTIGAVRRDADTTLVDTTNEVAPLQVDARGALKVEAFSGETLPVSLTSTTITGTVTADTELPAAAALADNTSNPTAPAVGAFLMGFDGTNWDRLQTGAATGGALKVDGSAVTQPVSAVSLPLPSGAATLAGQTQPGVDIGDVTINNASGASAVNVQDGGNSLTVDGTVTADTELPAAAALADNTSNPTVPAVGSFLMAFDGTNWDRVQTGAATGGALKVDGSAVTQPVSGTVTANQGTAGTAWEIIGDVAADAAVPTNPVIVGARASTAQPSPVSADGDSVNIWANRKGAPIVSMAPHVGLFGDPWTLTSVTAQYTTTQTSAVLLAGGASERIVVTKIGIQAGGTTAGTLQVYFGTGAYSRGTSLAIFDGEFAPSATLKPGVRDTGPFISATNGDDVLVTTSAAINPLTVTIWYYIVT